MYKNLLPLDYQCPICGAAQQYRKIAQITDKYAAIKCLSCDLSSVYPMPSIEELTNYYSNYSATQENDLRNSVLVEMHQGILEYLVSMLRNQPNLSFLDYGFGSGAFLKQVNKNGFSSYGIEFSIQNCDQLQNYCDQVKGNIKIINIQEESLDNLLNKKFDCITLFQVIEHVIDPVTTVKFLHSIQKKGGILYIECPNNDAFYLKFKNAIRKQVGRETFFASLNPPQHLYGFNRNSLKVLIEKAGYTLIEISDYPLADKLHQVETMFWYPSFSEMMANSSLWNFYHLSKFMIRLIEPIASKFIGAGGGMYAVAHKN